MKKSKLNGYRKALGNLLAHDCLARVFSVKLTGKNSRKDIEFLNTAVRGQIILGSDESKDIGAINGMVKLDAYMKTLPLEVKKQTMTGIVAGSLDLHTFGISYTGNIGWGGLEKYVRDVHSYAGEQSFSGRISAEIFTIGDNFPICLMQPGKNPAFAESLRKAFQDCGIECLLTGESRYQMPDYKI